jgi:hypothetical protein
MRPHPLHPHPLVTALLALALLSTASACQPSEPWTSENPAFALDRFLAALRTGDHDTVEAFLSPQTLALLHATRQDLHDLLGEDATAHLERPADLLYRVWTPAATEIERLETVSRDEDSAVVAVHSIFGDVRHVALRRANRRWTIELVPDPVSPPTTPAENP